MSLSWEHEELSKIPFAVFRGHEGGINFVRLTRGERQILTASDDTNSILWDIATGEAIMQYGHNAEALKSVDHENSLILSCSIDRCLHLFDKDTGDEIKEIELGGIVTSCDYSPNGNYFCCTVDITNDANIYDARTYNLLHTIQLDSTPTTIEFSPNSQRVAIGTIRGKVIIWDVISKTTTIQSHDHTNAVSCVTFDKDERILASSSWDKSIRMLDVSTGEYRTKGTVVAEPFVIAHHGSVSSIRIFNSSEMMVSGGYDKRIMIWNINHNMAKIPIKGHQDWVTAVDGSNSGRYILSGCRDSTIRFWNIEKIEEIPLVIENNRQHGIRTETCTECKRPFSVAVMDELLFTGLCVFCRLVQRNESDRNEIYYED